MTQQGDQSRIMHVHLLQHVAFEGLGSIEPWLRQHQCRISSTPLYAGQALPAAESIDWLIIAGGPMSVHDRERYPWLDTERQFIGDFIATGKPVLGICLGAQLIAQCLGAEVQPNPHKEIGWHDLHRDEQLSVAALTAFLPQQFGAFHWHGETFTLPDGAVRLASSAACLNQGFIYRQHVIALQCHLETTMAAAQALIDHCSDELVADTYIQSARSMLAQPQRFDASNEIMNHFLNYLFKLAIHGH